jgi:hypothetical protein
MLVHPGDQVRVYQALEDGHAADGPLQREARLQLVYGVGTGHAEQHGDPGQPAVQVEQ